MGQNITKPFLYFPTRNNLRYDNAFGTSPPLTEITTLRFFYCLTLLWKHSERYSVPTGSLKNPQYGRLALRQYSRPRTNVYNCIEIWALKTMIEELVVHLYLRFVVLLRIILACVQVQRGTPGQYYRAVRSIYMWIIWYIHQLVMFVYW